MATRPLRRLLNEVRLSFDSGIKVQDKRITQYILNQYKKHQVTEKQNCKAAQEMTFLADSFATYLASSRKWRSVHDEYHHGELTVEQTAQKVGFKLPHDPK